MLLQRVTVLVAVTLVAALPGPSGAHIRAPGLSNAVAVRCAHPTQLAGKVLHRVTVQNGARIQTKLRKPRSLKGRRATQLVTRNTQVLVFALGPQPTGRIVLRANASVRGATCDNPKRKRVLELAQLSVTYIA